MQSDIPPTISRARTSTVCILSDDQQMSGVFPKGIVHLPFLETIGFSKNSLSGNLPKDIKNMDHLVEVFIGENKFSGEVPIEWWQSGVVGSSRQLPFWIHPT